MEIRQLRYFIVVSDLKSLTAAGEYLNISQPALGQQVRNLENSLGTRLFDRHSRGVQLTEAGRTLRNHAVEILASVGRAEDDVRRFSQSAFGTVRIGVTPSLGRVLVPQILEVFSERYPETRLQFTQGYIDALVREIEAGNLDIATISSLRDSTRLETVPLLVESINLVGVPELVAGLSDPVSLETLVDIPMVIDNRSEHYRMAVDGGLKKKGLEIKDVVEIQAINIRRELVTQGKRCSIAPAALFASEREAGYVISRKIDFPELTRTLHLATPRVETMTPAQAAVRNLIIEVTDSMIASKKHGWRLPQQDE